MSYKVYVFLHIVALISVFASTGAIVSHVWQGGTKENLKNRKPLMMIHGIGLLVAVVAGFGLIAKRQYSLTSDHWLYIKILCWMAVGALPGLMFKKVLPGKAGMAVLILIAVVAVGAVAFLANEI
jgi:hypothetical protein